MPEFSAASPFPCVAERLPSIAEITPIVERRGILSSGKAPGAKRWQRFDMSEHGREFPRRIGLSPKRWPESVCRQCFELLDPGDNFCRYCGGMTEHGAAMVKIGKLPPPATAQPRETAELDRESRGRAAGVVRRSWSAGAADALAEPSLHARLEDRVDTCRAAADGRRLLVRGRER